MLKELAIIIFIFLSQFNISSVEKDLTGSVLGLSDFEMNGTNGNKINENGLYLAPAFSQARVLNNDDLKMSAKSAMAINVKTGSIAYEKNIQKKMPIASLTKLMTALVVLDKVDLESQVIISRNAIAAEGNKGNLKVDEKITVKNLLYLLLVDSSNDAAVALAEHIAGSENEFVRLMNEKAKALNLRNTHFANSTGLDKESNYSTAYDLAKLTEHALGKPLLWNIMRVQNLDVSSIDGQTIHHLKNTNKLLGKLPDINIVGGKTGFTDQAGECLILVASHPENNERIIFVILGSEDRFGEMKELIGWVYGGKG